MSQTTISVKPKVLAPLLMGISGVLLILHVIGHWLRTQHEDLGIYFNYVETFNLNSEVSVGTWYASLLLFVVAVLFWVNARADTPNRKGWYFFTAAFIFLSIDEGAEVHEYLDPLIRAHFDVAGTPNYLWVIPAGTVALVAIIYLVRFLNQFSTRGSRVILFGAVTLFFGAVCVEVLGGNYIATHGISTPATYLTFNTINGIEETFEQLGSIIAILGACMHLAERKAKVLLDF